jgi:hypothetical protein
MARELGLNPDKLGKIANHKQERWKSPLPEFIEDIYFKRFNRTEPAFVKSIDELVADEKTRREHRKQAKAEKRKAKAEMQENNPLSDEAEKTEKPSAPPAISQKPKLQDKQPKVKIRIKNGDTPETVLLKEAHLLDEAFDFFEKESVTPSHLGNVLKKMHPRYKPRRYGCKILAEIYEKLGRYEVVRTEGQETVIRRKTEKNNI